MDQRMAQQVLTAILGQEALENAMGVFHMAVDKEIAQMAAYKSLGLDPRDIQKFGWLQMLGIREGNVNVTQTTGSPTPPEKPLPAPPLVASISRSALVPAILGVALAVGGGLAGHWLSRVPMPTPPTVINGPAQAWDAVYYEQQPDGTWKFLKRECLK